MSTSDGAQATTELTGETLARRPPMGSLIWLVIHSSFAGLAIWANLAIITSEKNLLDPNVGGLFWVRVGFMVVMTGLAAWWLFLSLRLASRWLLSGAGIFSTGATVRFCIPTSASFWNPMLSIRPAEFPLDTIRGTTFSAEKNSALTVKMATEKIEVPGESFGAGSYALDARLRALTYRQDPDSAFLPIKPSGLWSATGTKRTALLVVALLLSFGPIFFVVFLLPGGDEAGLAVYKLLGPPMIAGFGFLALAALYRGDVIVDERGVFHQRGGKTTFIPWELAKKGKVKFSSEIGGLWSTLEVIAYPEGKRLKEYRVRLNRGLWLGWPLKDIHRTIEEALRGQPD